MPRRFFSAIFRFGYLDDFLRSNSKSHSPRVPVKFQYREPSETPATVRDQGNARFSSACGVSGAEALRCPGHPNSDKTRPWFQHLVHVPISKGTMRLLPLAAASSCSLNWKARAHASRKAYTKSPGPEACYGPPRPQHCFPRSAGFNVGGEVWARMVLKTLTDRPRVIDACSLTCGEQDLAKTKRPNGILHSVDELKGE